MKTKIILTTVSTLALLALVGCGKPTNDKPMAPSPTNAVANPAGTNSATSAPAAPDLANTNGTAVTNQ